jgi:transposase
MAGEDILMVRQKELKRLHVIKKVLENGIKQVEAAEILGLSSRQIRRIVKRVKLEGDKGVIHKSRGQPSNRRISDTIKGKIIELYRSQYSDFGPTLASEKLQERDQLEVSDETLRLWLLESGDWKERRKTRGHRRWRERKAHRGEMVQMDGSHHDWFEERGPHCVLMSYIDDATGRVFGRFYEYEGTMPAMDSFKRYSRKYGLPSCLYLDRHTTYKSPAKVSVEDILNEEVPLSEFERALKELGVELIHAMSPQAKGRVERLFRTLQDRLVKEMRLRGIGTIEEANAFLKQYLPAYNRRFSVLPREREDLHRPLPKGFNLDAVLCIKTERRLRNDFTVAHNKKLYQIEDRTRASKVMVHEYMNGSLRMSYRDQSLRFKQITTRPQKQQQAPMRKARKKPPIPSADHPWRRGFKFGGHRRERDKTILRPENIGMPYDAYGEDFGDPF